MTIEYPRALPSLRIAGFSFELDRSTSDTVGREQGGRLVSVERGPPAWRMALSTTPASDAEYGDWQAWLSSLKGSGRLFYGHNAWRRYPRRYATTKFTDLERAGGGAFDGTSATWSVNTARDEIEIETLPISFRLSPGDMVGVTDGDDVRSLHRVLEDANAGGDGVGVWSIEPGLPPWVTDGTVNLVAPVCFMKLIPGTARVDRDGKSRRVSFEALQTVRP